MTMQHLHSLVAVCEMTMQHLHSVVAVCGVISQHLHSVVVVCETTMQHLRSVAAVCEMTMQHLRSLVAVCGAITQHLHSLFIVYEMITQGLHGLFTVCARPFSCPPGRRGGRMRYAPTCTRPNFAAPAGAIPDAFSALLSDSIFAAVFGDAKSDGPVRDVKRESSERLEQCPLL